MSGDGPDGPGELEVVLLYQPIVREEARRLTKGLRAFPDQARSLPQRKMAHYNDGCRVAAEQPTGLRIPPNGSGRRQLRNGPVSHSSRVGCANNNHMLSLNLCHQVAQYYRPLSQFDMRLVARHNRISVQARRQLQRVGRADRLLSGPCQCGRRPRAGARALVGRRVLL